MKNPVKQFEIWANNLPERDIKLAKKFLEQRDFERLLELVNSDVELTRKYQNSENPGKYADIDLDVLLEFQFELFNYYKNIVDDYTSTEIFEGD
jgi:hypothetical protein